MTLRFSLFNAKAFHIFRAVCCELRFIICTASTGLFPPSALIPDSFASPSSGPSGSSLHLHTLHICCSLRDDCQSGVTVHLQVNECPSTPPHQPQPHASLSVMLRVLNAAGVTAPPSPAALHRRPERRCARKLA